MDTWYDDKYKFYHGTSWCKSKDISENNWEDRLFVSLNKSDDILGLIGYHIDRANDYIDCLWIINFSEDKVTFGRDVGKTLDDIFTKYNFRKLAFSVIVGNPIEKSYDKLIHKYGGKIVGTYKENVKLMDNKYYDEKLYEIFREDYMKYITTK
jgi:RimJ/RimL family protein N-acetyltransferase